MLTLELIGYSCGTGAPDRRCSTGPEVMKAHGLAQHLASPQVGADWQPFYHSTLPDSRPAPEIIADYTAHLSQQVQQAIARQALPFTIGGDHTMAIGSWSGIADAHQLHGQLGLIWIDAHMDAHSVTSSHSGAYHGMPLNYLLGYGKDAISAVTGSTPVLNPKHVVLVGIRSFEAEEHAILKASGVTVFFMDDIQKRGFAAVMAEALAIATTGTGGFGISLDLDVFDPSVAPGTGSLAKTGLFPDETLPVLQGIGYHGKLKGFEIAEFNPALDRHHMTAQLVMDIAGRVFTLPPHSLL